MPQYVKAVDLALGFGTATEDEVEQLLGPGFKSSSSLKRLGVYQSVLSDALRDALAQRFPRLTV